MTEVDHDALDAMDDAIADIDADERDGMGISPKTQAKVFDFLNDPAYIEVMRAKAEDVREITLSIDQTWSPGLVELRIQALEQPHTQTLTLNRNKLAALRDKITEFLESDPS